MSESVLRVSTAIIGGGVAGLSAAIFASRLELESVVLDRLGPGGQTNNVGRVENFPGFPEGVDGLELGPLVTQQAMSAGVRVEPVEVASVTRGDADLWILETDGPQVVADVVVLASGSRLVPLGIDREVELHGRGVSYCAACDAPMFAGQDVIVVGGGDSAVDEALHLSDVVRQVTVVTRDTDLTAAASVSRRLVARPNVTVLFEHEVRSLSGEFQLDSVTVVDRQTGREQVLAASGIFVFIGLAPNSDLVKDVVSLTDTGHVPVEYDMSTQAAGLYAIGDVRQGPARYFVTAAGDGATAAVAAYEYVSSKRGESVN